VPVQVVEPTGSPGDVVVTHLHVFHARSPNAGAVPRLMLGKEIRRAGETRRGSFPGCEHRALELPCSSRCTGWPPAMTWAAR
jgi:hypothetical protein